MFIAHGQIICKAEYDDFKKLSSEYARQCDEVKDTFTDEDEVIKF